MKISFSAPLVFLTVVSIEACFVLGMKSLLDQSESALLKAEKSARIVRESQNIVIGLSKMNQAVHDSAWFESKTSEAKFNGIKADINRSLNVLSQEVNSSAESEAALQSLKSDLADSISLCDDYFRLFKVKGSKNLVETLQAELDTFQSIMSRTLTHSEDLLREQKSLLVFESSSQLEQRNQLKNILLVALTLNTIFVTCLTGLFANRLASRLRRLVENTNRLKDGLALMPQMEGDDEIVQLDAVFHDLSSSLAAAQRKEGAYFENAADVLGSLDSDGNFTRVSPASFAMWGLTPDSLVSKAFADLCLVDDHELTEDWLLKAQLGQEPVSFENRIKRPNGRIIQCLWTLKWSREEKSFFFTAHDTTLRKENDELLKGATERTVQIIQAMPVGLFLASKDGYIQFVNETLADLLQFNEADLGGEHLTKVFALGEVNQGTSIQFDNFAGITTELLATNANGWGIHVDFSLRSITFGDSDCYLGLVVDTTQRYELERLRQEFFAMITHELRSPLASVQSHIEMSLMGINGTLNGSGERGAKNSLASIERLLKLIADIIDSEKLSAGSFQIHLESVSTSAIVQSALAEVRALANASDIRLSLNLVEANIKADHERVVQVLVNLLSNAIKFSPHESLLTVSLSVVEPMIRFEITDEGRGIPKDRLKSLFKKFMQIERSDSKGGAGSGLGLSIAKELIEKQNGRIGVVSELGKGSTFWFELPIAKT